MCIVSANNGECSAVNTWRDEDQDLGKVLKGFQSYAMSYWSDDKDQPPPYRAESTVQGLKFGIMCLSQLTATQFAQVQLNPEVGPVNKGRLILVTALQRLVYGAMHTGGHLLYLLVCELLCIAHYCG